MRNSEDQRQADELGPLNGAREQLKKDFATRVNQHAKLNVEQFIGHTLTPAEYEVLSHKMHDLTEQNVSRETIVNDPLRGIGRQQARLMDERFRNKCDTVIDALELVQVRYSYERLALENARQIMIELKEGKL